MNHINWHYFKYVAGPTTIVRDQIVSIEDNSSMAANTLPKNGLTSSSKKH
jgi:hypothetical protein